MPESEQSKSLPVWQKLISKLARGSKMRVPILAAFGGGVVGDLAGFVAAVYRRGIPLVQLPTTLLAQVDSAIGGKVGIDLPEAKNIIGAFHQPLLVWINLSLLRTLPMRQRQSGLAEIIKYGVIADPGLFHFIETHLGDCLNLDPQAIRRLVVSSCRIKAGIVSRDERETTHLRAQLNFGHTLGHALEAATGYSRWTHGEAIAVGMCAAAHMSAQLGICALSEAQRLERLIEKAGLPTYARDVSRNRVARALRYDKKFIRGKPRWVLPIRIGKVVVTEAVPARLVDQVLKQRVGK